MGVISTSLALKHGIVPPNLHFDNLSPKVAPFFKHLDIPTTPTAWPTSGSEVRRASVNRYVITLSSARCLAYSLVSVLDLVGPTPTAFLRPSYLNP